MKAKAIIIASVLLVGCQASRHDAKAPNQYAQSLSSASQSETGKYTDSQSSGQWMGGSNTAAQQHLWNFISDELKMSIPDNSRVREQKNKFLKNKSYLHDVTLRAEPYMYWIVEQIEKRKMPMELVLLPIVESAFDPHVTSHANAAGLWQIVPQTGRNYGLKQNQWYDGRRDVVASTTAAMDIMQRLNRMFNGDWLLTIAAYNSGEGRVMKAMKANKAKGLSTNFWALSLPRETSVYVPKMLALSDIIKHHKRYGIKLPTPNKERALARIEVGQQIELTQAAEMSGLSLTKLKSFNPGYIRNVTAPNGPHYIMVPKSHASKFKNSLAGTQIAKIKPRTAEKDVDIAHNSKPRADNRATRSSYTVRSGDTLSTIAKRLNISPVELQSINQISSSKKLKVGQTLQVASNTNSRSANKSQASNKGSSITYRVRKGDSLYSIAKRHGVKINDVMRWNTVIAKTNRIQPGDTLTLFVAKNMLPGS